MIEQKDLIGGHTYWYTNNTVMRKLVFMYKVKDRKQYYFKDESFAGSYGKQPVRIKIKGSQLFQLYLDYQTAARAMAKRLRMYADSYDSVANERDGGVDIVYMNGAGTKPIDERMSHGWRDLDPVIQEYMEGRTKTYFADII